RALRGHERQRQGHRLLRAGAQRRPDPRPGRPVLSRRARARDRILRRDEREEGDPALYSVSSLSKFKIPWIPEEGTYRVYLIYFEDGKGYKIDGQIDGTKSLLLAEKPPRNCLVLFEYEDGVSPYAVYNAEMNQIEYLDSLPKFGDASVVVYPKDTALEEEFKNQEYYVLENQYAQYVFTNINGAVCEINLPFHSEKNSQSVVLEIEFDRTIQEDYPSNDRFPQFSYTVADGKGQTKKVSPQRGGYYPLLRRNIMGTSGGDTTTRVNPHYYAFNIFEKGESPDANTYRLSHIEKNRIEFEFSEGNRRITKTYSLPEEGEAAPYCLDLEVKIDGDARNLIMATGIPEVELISGNFVPTLKYRLLQNQKSKVQQIKPPKQFVSLPHVNAEWYCNGNGFFGIILDPLNKHTPGIGVHPVSGELVPSRISIIDAQHNRYPAGKYPGYCMDTPIASKQGITKYRVFTGPFDKSILQLLDRTFADPVTGTNPDYQGAQSFHGWFAAISQPFAKFLYIILNFFHTWTHSWGFSIILLTIVLRLMLYPLNNWSMKSTAKMQKVGPKLKAIQEKYKKDPNRVRMETMNLYRKEKVNPFGGCFPMLIQLPFLFGMFDLLKSSFELRGAVFIPGWINNLTAPDVLFSWNYPIPFVGTSFHLLPFILGAIMFVQQKFMTTASLSNATTDQQKQQRSMGNIMTVVFTILFYNFPSGLNLYWISSMSLGILQQWLVNKKIQAEGK
ncbi:MAG: hypothetical protein K1000chlam2_00670, partial [Chlamydiae bacterium]|nr:hypothetical protein [Chlamydiota bacterium]